MTDKIYVLFSIHLGNMKYIPIGYKNLEDAKKIKKKQEEKSKNLILYGIEEWSVK